MLITLRLSGAILVVTLIAGTIAAQRPRATTQDPNATDVSTNMPPPAPAPARVNAKYEGGVFGYTKKMTGTLNFEDESRRLVFRDKTGKEILFVPYDAINGAFNDIKKVQPAAATVAQNAPIPGAGLAGSLIKTTVRYLSLQYSDEDSRVSGIAVFKLDNQEIMDSVLYTLANKAGLTPRGQIYVRKATKEASK
ncbi:MAG TPA: hypothetical protein VN476_17670 [Pyrinomonadaceae bacterium]|nr:hypothetical protein [Pyrinomonadaceae bacterium]